MGIRRAVPRDFSRIIEIRQSVRENRLSDTGLVTAKDCADFIERSEIWVWEEDDAVQGFAAGDVRDGWIWALFVAPGHEGRGIGQALMPLACELCGSPVTPLRPSARLKVPAPNGSTRQMVGP